MLIFHESTINHIWHQTRTRLYSSIAWTRQIIPALLNTCTLIKIYILQYQFKLHIIILYPTGNMVSITHDLFWLQQNSIRSSVCGGGCHQPHNALNAAVCLWDFKILSRDKAMEYWNTTAYAQDICYFPRHYQPRDLWSYSLSLALFLGAGPNLFSCSHFNLSSVVKFNHYVLGFYLSGQ